jgi:hypothetical protein
MGMNLMPPFSHLSVEIGNAIDDRHQRRFPTAVLRSLAMADYRVNDLSERQPLSGDDACGCS